MELELGLALPISGHFPTKAYHLDQPQLKNAAGGGLAMEFKSLMMITQRQNQKRSFSLAFDDGEVEDHDPDSNTLSLLVWNGRRPKNHDDDEDDDGEGHRRKPLDTTSQKDEDEDQIVGWPPIRSWRKKLLLRGGGQGYRIAADHHQRDADNNNNKGGGGRNSIFVKVKMEGVMIGRKIDLMLFNSYQALTTTLLNMFAKYRKGDKDDGPCILSYLDKDGDWLLAGDVPWQRFINSVQRIEILKGSN